MLIVLSIVPAFSGLVGFTLGVMATQGDYKIYLADASTPKQIAELERKRTNAFGACADALILAGMFVLPSIALSLSLWVKAGDRRVGEHGGTCPKA
jgi:hypothetical protein